MDKTINTQQTSTTNTLLSGLWIEELSSTIKDPQNKQWVIIFIHGLGGDSQAWEQVISILKTTIPAQFVRYDLRGHGQSTHTFPTHLKTLYEVSTQDLHSICQQYTKSKLILVGHSWGGIVLQEFLNRYQPTNLIGSVFINSTFSAPFQFLSKFHTFFYQQLQKVNPQNHTAHLKTRNWKSHLSYKNHFDYSATRIYSDIRSMGFLMYIFYWLAAFGWRNTQVQKLDKETNLYVYGKHDVIVSPHTQIKQLRNIKKMHIQTVASNHNPLINTPEELTAILNVHLSKLIGRN